MGGTAEFIESFVRPMLVGGSVQVGAPYSLRDRAQMLDESGALLDDMLRFDRMRRARALIAEPPLPDPDIDELSLWLGLHNILALDHPDIERVWARASTWRRVESSTRTLLTLSPPRGMAEALARHVALGGFLSLVREDHVVLSSEGEVRHRGRPPPGRRFPWFGGTNREVRVERVQWLSQTHESASDRLVGDAMVASPLTSLLEPAWAPSGWSPLSAAGLLGHRGLARAVCHHWAADARWQTLGAVVAGSLLRSLDLARAVFGDEVGIVSADEDVGEGESVESGEPEAEGGTLALAGEVLPDGPAEVGAIIGSLIHLHLLKVLEFDARIAVGVSTRDWAVQAFLAMPLLLPALREVLGDPFGAGGARDIGRDARRRWTEYVDHVRGLVPRPVVENLVAALVPRVVEERSA